MVIGRSKAIEIRKIYTVKRGIEQIGSESRA
jgi:hypothetical protein